MRQPGEPSVEEILESIKKVIARDSREIAAETRRQRESRGLADAAPEAPAAAREPVADVLDLAVSARFLEDEPVDEPEDEADADAEAGADRPLITDESRVAMRQSLAALAMMSEPGATPRIVRSGETSLEELTRELLRPALADWLDKNLPPMVERMVAAEIARIVGKKA